MTPRETLTWLQESPWHVATQEGIRLQYWRGRYEMYVPGGDHKISEALCEHLLAFGTWEKS